MKKEIKKFIMLLFIAFNAINAISQIPKVKIPQKTQASMVPVFHVSPVTDSAVKVSNNPQSSKPLLKAVTEKLSSEEIEKISTHAPVDFTLSPRFPFIERKGQLGGDRISIVDLWQDNYLIRPETNFGGYFTLEKNKTYLCTVGLTLYPGSSLIRVSTYNGASNESLVQDFSLSNNERNVNGRRNNKNVEISFILKTSGTTGYVQVFLLDKGTTDFYFNKWNVKELAVQY